MHLYMYMLMYMQMHRYMCMRLGANVGSFSSRSAACDPPIGWSPETWWEKPKVTLCWFWAPTWGHSASEAQPVMVMVRRGCDHGEDDPDAVVIVMLVMASDVGTQLHLVRCQRGMQQKHEAAVTS